ncbi:hypothetical protein StoSoilB19_25780 [Arthrobacter sp. StoSoilB19]|nr:hypothetical protein StoSoilB19_25780 [Arthrobacter sp. StoSoilB19]
MAADQDVHGVDLDELEAGKSTAHRPCCHGAGGPYFMESLRCQCDPPCLVKAQRC